MLFGPQPVSVGQSVIYQVLNICISFMVQVTCLESYHKIVRFIIPLSNCLSPISRLYAKFENEAHPYYFQCYNMKVSQTEITYSRICF